MTKAEQVIKDLANTDWGKDNDAQMKAVQLLKGLALSNEDISNEFMKALSNSSTNIAKTVLNMKEQKEERRNIAESYL